MTRADRLLDLDIPDVVQSYGPRDVILYGLGVGLGLDPTDKSQLAYVYEDGLDVLPSFAVVLGHPGFWPRDLDTGLDYSRIVHGEQTLRLERPLREQATITSKSRITGVSDKGEGKGAVVGYERAIYDENGDLLAVVGQTLFCRGDGGMGSAGKALPRSTSDPEGAPTARARTATSPQAALIYRLSGDMNPLHADPRVASGAGFDRPILHGLASYGAVTFAVLQATGRDARALRALDCRFRAPVFPGETLDTAVWRSGDVYHFTTRVAERDVLVLSNGRAEFQP